MGGSRNRDPGTEDKTRSQNITICGDAKGNAFVHGDCNLTEVSYVEVTLPPAETVDIQQELEKLRSILARIESADQKKLDHRLEEAIDEARQEDPDKGDVSRALEGAIKYAKRAKEFSEVAEELIPRITNVCGWLGGHGAPLLSLMGLTA